MEHAPFMQQIMVDLTLHDGTYTFASSVALKKFAKHFRVLDSARETVGYPDADMLIGCDHSLKSVVKFLDLVITTRVVNNCNATQFMSLFHSEDNSNAIIIEVSALAIRSLAFAMHFDVVEPIKTFLSDCVSAMIKIYMSSDDVLKTEYILFDLYPVVLKNHTYELPELTSTACALVSPLISSLDKEHVEICEIHIDCVRSLIMHGNDHVQFLVLENLPTAVVKFDLGAKAISEILPLINKKDKAAATSFLTNTIIASLNKDNDEVAAEEIARAAKAIDGVDICEILFLSRCGPWMHAVAVDQEHAAAKKRKTRSDDSSFKLRQFMWKSENPGSLLDHLRKDSFFVSNIISNKRSKLIRAISTDRDGNIIAKAAVYMQAAAKSLSDDAQEWMASLMMMKKKKTAA